MYSLRLTVRDAGLRYKVTAHIIQEMDDGSAELIAQSEPLTFMATEQTSLDPFQAILEVASDAARAMTDSGFRPRYCETLF